MKNINNELRIKLHVILKNELNNEIMKKYHYGIS